MTPVFIFLFFSSILSIRAHFIVDGGILEIYSETDGQEEFSLDLLGDEVFYVDFQKKEVIHTLPSFVGIKIDYEKYFPPIYATADWEMDKVKNEMDGLKKAFNNPPPAQEAPTSALYPKNKVRLGSDNTLICLVTGFYPPRVTVRWTKNIQNVTKGATLSRYHINEDKSFKVFSTLKFTPQEGDMYTCTVEHEALDDPLTKYWDVEVSEPSLGPSVLCGVGLTLGLLGVATGTFYFIKGRVQSKPRPQVNS